MVGVQAPGRFGSLMGQLMPSGVPLATSFNVSSSTSVWNVAWKRLIMLLSPTVRQISMICCRLKADDRGLRWCVDAIGERIIRQVAHLFVCQSKPPTEGYVRGDSIEAVVDRRCRHIGEFAMLRRER